MQGHLNVVMSVARLEGIEGIEGPCYSSVTTNGHVRAHQHQFPKQLSLGLPIFVCSGASNSLSQPRLVKHFSAPLWTAASFGSAAACYSCRGKV